MVNKQAAKTAEEATDLIGWILNHGQVHSVFNEVQADLGKVYTFLVANLTRWGTHFIAFHRLCLLKEPMEQAALL